MPNSSKSTPHHTIRLPLTGADCFLRAFDAETRRRNRASHLSQLVLRLGPGFDVEALRHWMTQVVSENPILHAPIARRFGLGAPLYFTDRASRCIAPRIEVYEGNLTTSIQHKNDIHQSMSNFHVSTSPVSESTRMRRLQLSDPLPELFFERLNEVRDIRRGELLRIDVVRYDEGRAGTDVALTWVHMLFDGSGSENFIRYLDACFRSTRSVAQLPSDDVPREQEGGLVGMKGRGLQAKAWGAHLDTLAATPPHSLAGPARNIAQNLRFDLITLTPQETTAVTELAAQRAGFLTPMLFYLAASIRAHHAIFEKHGIDPGSYVVPLPVNMRPKGGEGAIFRTRVSMLWFQVQKDRVHSMDELIADLKEQRKNLIKNGAVTNGMVAMDFARFIPKRIYAKMAHRTFAGELCSFFFAYTDKFLAGLDSFLGAAILNGFHSPSVPASPGSSAVFSIRNGRLNFTHIYQSGIFTEDDLEIFRARLLADLGVAAHAPSK